MWNLYAYKTMRAPRHMRRCRGVSAALVLLLATACAESSGPPSPCVLPWVPAMHVFFSYGNTEMLDQSREGLALFLPQLLRWQPNGRFCLTGHTDSSGSPAANDVLARQRAMVVADYLVELGVARERIEARSVGSSGLLVPTPPNTREPQNRRVHVLMVPPDEPCPAQAQ